jgi:hypothetical protein
MLDPLIFNKYISNTKFKEYAFSRKYKILVYLSDLPLNRFIKLMMATRVKA